MNVTARIDGKELEVTPSELRELLARVGPREVWLELGDDGPRLCALITGDRGWLMYLREPGDSGLSSRNPRYRGKPDASIEYRLSNGQVDAYPASWAYDLATVYEALIEFAAAGMPPTPIQWHAD